VRSDEEEVRNGVGERQSRSSEEWITRKRDEEQSKGRIGVKLKTQPMMMHSTGAGVLLKYVRYLLKLVVM